MGFKYIDKSVITSFSKNLSYVLYARPKKGV